MEKICAILVPKIVIMNDKLKQLITDSIKKLIIEENVTKFLFGPKSNFGYACLSAVSELKKEYPHIQRICYVSKNEHYTIKNEDNNIKQYDSKQNYNCLQTICFDKEICFKNNYFTDNYSHFERNCKMIDESDICLFYYDKNNPNTIFYFF